MNKLRVRHWALISHGAEAGKTTFLASNARPPLFVVDTDGRFGAGDRSGRAPVGTVGGPAAAGRGADQREAGGCE